MGVTQHSTAWRLLGLLFCLVTIRVAGVVVLGYPDDFPPDFQSDFLAGREAYFFGSYRWAFYTHVVSGPVTLLLGLLLLSDAFRRRYPARHRVLGRMQIAAVLLLVAPSGFWMAWRAPTPLAVAGFTSLAVLTGVCGLQGWRAAVRRRFQQHRRWMTRCYALLWSAVVLRAIGGASEVLGVTGAYPYAAWLSWLIPLAVVEGWWLIRVPSLRPLR